MNSVPPHVADEEELHRLLNPAANACGVDGRVHYMAFFSSTDPHHISVDRARHRTVEESLRGRERHGLAQLETGKVRALPVTPPLVVESMPENGNDAHAEIVAHETISKNGMKTKVCVLLAGLASVVLQPSR